MENNVPFPETDQGRSIVAEIATSIPFVIITSDLRVLHRSDAMTNLLGQVPAEQPLLNALSVCLHVDDRAPFLRLVESWATGSAPLEDGGRPFRLMCSPSSDAVSMYFAIRVFEVQRGSDPQVFALQLIDITTRVEMERQISILQRELEQGHEREEKLGSMMAELEVEFQSAMDRLTCERLENRDVLHDFAAQLSTIKLQLQILRSIEKGGTGNWRNRVEIIEHEVDRLISAHSYMRAVNHGRDIVLEEGDVVSKAFLEVVFRSHVDRMQILGKELTLEIAGSARSLKVDRNLVERILDNLLDNAAKYATGRRITLGTGIWTDRATSREHWVIYVEDEGPGVPVDEQLKIFERGVRGSTGQHIPGTGLGLAICQDVMSRHGGRLVLDSVVGRSRFMLVFPDERVLPVNEE